MTKKQLKKELIRADQHIKTLTMLNDQLMNHLCDALDDNAFLNSQMDKAIRVIEAKKRAKAGTPSWLKQIIAET